MENFIIVAVIAVIIALAIFYICKAKKNGKKCIGCPDNCSCCSKGCGCSQGNKKIN